MIRRLVAQLPAAVSFVALEVGQGQADAVSALLAGAGFAAVERHRDLAGVSTGGGRAAVSAATAFAAAVGVGRGGRVPVRHGLRTGLRSRGPRGGRAAVCAQAAVAPEKRGGGHVLLGGCRAGGAARARAADHRRRSGACCRAASPSLLANPAGRFPLACAADPSTLGLRVPVVPLLSEVAPPRAAVQRKPVRRRRPSAAGRRAGLHPPRAPTWPSTEVSCRAWPPPW